MGPSLQLTDLASLGKSVFTPRVCLSILNGCYDPAGLCAPFLAKYKISLREITMLGLHWDDSIPSDLQAKWRNLVEELVRLEGIEFSRAVRPDGATGLPWLIGAWDGADQAYQGKVYARWETGEKVEVRLVACKVRVVPTKGLTTPRSELNGLLVMTRLLSAIIDAMNEKPARVICFGDSECTISSCECRTATLAPYFSNRVAEVLDTFTRFREQGIEVDPLYWIPGDQNPADQGTREDV